MKLDIFTDFDLLSRWALRLWQGLDSKTISTFILILAVLIARSIIIAWLENSTKIAPHTVNQWRQRMRNITLACIVIFLVVIWAPELRAFAVTLVAVAAAIVIALKEVITCLIGSIVRSNVEGAHIGGRIIVNNVRGDVASTDLLSTTILEVNEYGQRTGRTVSIPNSFYISHPTTTESAGDRKYVLLLVGIPAKRDENWQTLEALLLDTGKKLSDPYIKEAKKHFARFDRRYGFNAPGPEPKVLIDWTDPEKIMVSLRMAVPVTEQNSKRQEILRAVLSHKPEKTGVSLEDKQDI